LSNFIYNKAFTAYDYGVTSAASLVLFAIIAAITLFQFRVEKKMSS
jgi:multiple sugar transport system permease protein